MARKKCPKKHTPITSKKQRGAMGIAYAAKKGEISPSELKSPAKQMYKSMPEAELKRHLKESKGKKLPEVAKRKTKERPTGSATLTSEEICRGYRVIQ